MMQKMIDFPSEFWLLNIHISAALLTENSLKTLNQDKAWSADNEGLVLLDIQVREGKIEEIRVAENPRDRSRFLWDSNLTPRETYNLCGGQLCRWPCAFR
jgi:hypothetical protein